MTTVLLDSHVLHWWSAEPDRLSTVARTAVADAEELAVASITWFELAWLAAHPCLDPDPGVAERIVGAGPHHRNDAVDRPGSSVVAEFVSG